MISEVARRYAKAVFATAVDIKAVDQVFAELRSIDKALSSDAAIHEFINAPVIPVEAKMSAAKAALGGKVSDTVLNLLMLLIENGRAVIFGEIVQAYETILDEENGVTRGKVKSASAVSADGQKKIESAIYGVTKKKVILQFEEDASLMGGMVATVGGWTFDDSLKSHLGRLSEQLKRN